MIASGTSSGLCRDKATFRQQARMYNSDSSEKNKGFFFFYKLCVHALFSSLSRLLYC